MKNLLCLFIVLSFLATYNRCSGPSEENNQKSELSEEQDAAFDALNLIQVSTDEMNQFYSTFGGIEQPFYPADSSFEVSQEDLNRYLREFLYRHCTNLPNSQQEKLAELAALAQDKYTVLHCAEIISDSTYLLGLPMSDRWVIQNVQGRRDIIMLW